MNAETLSRSDGPALVPPAPPTLRHRFSLPRGSTRRALPRILRREIDRLRGSGKRPAPSAPWPPTWGELLAERPVECLRWRITPSGGAVFRCGWCSTCVKRKLEVLLGRAWAALGADADPAAVRVSVTETDEEFRELARREHRVVAFVQGESERRVAFFAGDGDMSERRLAERMLAAALGMRGLSSYDPDARTDPDGRDPDVATAKASRKQIRAAAAHLGYGVEFEGWGRFHWTKDGVAVVMAHEDFVGVATALSPGFAARAAPLPAAA